MMRFFVLRARVGCISVLDAWIRPLARFTGSRLVKPGDPLICVGSACLNVVLDQLWRSEE